MTILDLMEKLDERQSFMLYDDTKQEFATAVAISAYDLFEDQNIPQQIYNIAHDSIATSIDLTLNIIHYRSNPYTTTFFNELLRIPCHEWLQESEDSDEQR